MKALIRKLIREEDGQGIAEYGLLLALVAIIVVGALSLMGERVSVIFETVGSVF